MADETPADFPPGFWRGEDGALHVDLVTFLLASGYQATPENLAVIGEALRESLEAQYPGVPINIVESGARQ